MHVEYLHSLLISIILSHECNKCNYSTCFSRLQNDYIKLKSCTYCTHERMKDMKCVECNHSTSHANMLFFLISIVMSHQAGSSQWQCCPALLFWSISQLILDGFSWYWVHFKALMMPRNPTWSSDGILAWSLYREALNGASPRNSLVKRE